MTHCVAYLEYLDARTFSPVERFIKFVGAFLGFQTARELQPAFADINETVQITTNQWATHTKHNFLNNPQDDQPQTDPRQRPNRQEPAVLHQFALLYSVCLHSRSTMDQFLIILSPTLPATEQTGNGTTPDDIYAEWYPEPLRLLSV
ncbi:hypothetical protein PM082_015796 [Marasmius tenuissimus]|nr:hypothetical protein PM082_015796 [Marasmius tenuissimus]